MSGATVLDWLLHTLLGGGGVLLAARLIMGRLAAPARRQRLGEWAIAAGLLLALLSAAPAWLIVTLPVNHYPLSAVRPPPERSEPKAEEMPPTDPALAEQPAPAIPPWVFVAAPPEDNNVAAEPSSDPPAHREQAEQETPAAMEPVTPASGEPIVPRLIALALLLYVTGAAVLLGRWLLGHIVLWRLLRRAEPAPAAVAELFATMTSGCHRLRLLLSKRTAVPFSCGLFRPAVVLPAAMAEGMPTAVLRWVFTHELTHLRRQDACANLLFGLGQALYFPLPWFWWLRRHVRLCQEYIADAAASALGRPEDYAQFLLSWTAAPAAPAGVTGVCGSNSDLFRRITMLLQTPAPLEPRCPRRWSLVAAGGLLSLAVLVAGVGLTTQAAPVPVKKDQPKKDDKKKEDQKKGATKKDATKTDKPAEPDEILKDLPPGLDPTVAKQMREQMEHALRNLPPEQAKRMREQMAKMMQRMNQNFARGGQPGGGAGFPGGAGLGSGAFMRPGQAHEVRLGARVEAPSATLAEQLDLPKGQGLVLRDVQPDSAADKAGLKPHDILLELNGKPVPNRVDGLLKLMADIKPDTKVEAVVLRKGKKETIKGLSLPEAKAVPPGVPGVFPQFPGAGGPGGGFQPPGGGAGRPPAGFQPPGGGFPGGLGVGGGIGGQTVMTTVFRTADRFTTRHQEGSLVITLTGKVADGKGKVREIHVQDGRESHQYESVDKVPEQYRDKVKNLIEMSEKSSVKIEIKSP